MPAMMESMFAVKADGLPWHGLGTLLDAPPTIEQGLIDSGLNWPVELLDLQTVDGMPVPSRATVRTVTLEDGSTRRDVLGVVGTNYVPLQNADAFKFFSPFVESGECQLTTAGSLYDGKRIWVQAKINRPNAEIVTGDEITKMLLLAHSHDGSLAIYTGYTPIRVVCANTMAMAMQGRKNFLAKIRHTQSAQVRLDNVKDTIDGLNAEFEQTAEAYRVLAGKQVSAATLDNYLKTVFDMKPGEDGKLATRSANKLDDLVKLFDTGMGNQLPGVRGTLWAAYNAVTQSLSYDAGRNANNRMASLWFGVNADVNKKALETALALAV